MNPLQLSQREQNDKCSFPVQNSYYLHHRFKNLVNPLKFIQNNEITNLQANFEGIRSDIKRNNNETSEFSKAIYKKVISRENQYNFQLSKMHSDQFLNDIQQKFNNKYSKNGKIEKVEKRTIKKQDLQRQFKHGSIQISNQQKIQRQRSQKQIPLTFKHIKLLDTGDDFNERYSNVEFYDILKLNKIPEQFNYMLGSSYETINKNSIQNFINKNFQYKFIEESQFFSKQSYNFLFNCEKELRHWQNQNKDKIKEKKREKTKEEVLSICSNLDPLNITMFNVFDLASKNIVISDLQQYYKFKKEQQDEIQKDRSDQNLQKQYRQLQRQLLQKKEAKNKLKNTKIHNKPKDAAIQTISELKEQKQFADYFVQDAKNTFSKLKQLNEIRDKIIKKQSQPTFHVMATNIAIEINKQLFKLLWLMLKGENFPDYSEFVQAEQENDIQKKILEVIYFQFANFKNYQVNGISKFDIIKKYLQQKEKNQRFYQAYIFRNNEKITTTLQAKK